MISGIFHQGSGVGNQLHRYVATRVLALDKGFDWGMQNPELFKGSRFMNLDMGSPQPLYGFKRRFYEQRIGNHLGTDIRPYDASWEQIEDGTLIDGEFQDIRYFGHRLDEVRGWLAVEPLELPDDVCVIGFRGGEYTYFPDLFLRREFWDDAIAHMRSINPEMRFSVQTDDPETARKFFPDFEVVHDVGFNWRMIRYAKYLIVANSSFYILPALLNQEVRTCIAPLYWARHNVSDGYWALEQNKYPDWLYLDREGNLTQLEVVLPKQISLGAHTEADTL